MKRVKYLLVISLIFAALVFFGCEGDNGTGPGQGSSTASLISQGWSYYEAGNWNASANAFNPALNQADNAYSLAVEEYAAAAAIGDTVAMQAAAEDIAQQLGYILECLTGLGWVTIEYAQFDQSAFVFSTAMVIDPEHVDAIAGYAFSSQIEGDWNLSNELITKSLDIDETWEFQHNHNIDYLDLRIMRAENYFFLADFNASLAEAIDIATDPAVNYSPVPDPDDFNLATIEGRAALIELIDALNDMI